MCLWNIKKRRKSNQDVILAYKILDFGISQNRGLSPYQGFVFQPGTWYKSKSVDYKDEPRMLATEDYFKKSKHYLSGFHVYRDKKTAGKALVYFQENCCDRNGWKVVPVLVKDVRTEGTDGASTGKYYRTQLRPYCLVAQEILIVLEKQL